jgi:hypothetical protein
VLTDEQIEEITHETDETPTFGVVDDGRTYPAVTARRRQQNGSPRSTLYTVSKNGKYSHLYAQFERDIIQPYRERKRKRAINSGSVPVNTFGDVGVRAGQKSPQYVNRRNATDTPVNSVDGRT